MEIMTTTLSKPKVKSRVAAKLTTGKSKPARKRKPARAIPVAKADKKKVTGRKKQKAALSTKSRQKIKNHVAPGKSAKNKKAARQPLKPVNKKPSVNKTIPAKSHSIKIDIKQTIIPQNGHDHASKTKKREKTSMPETLTIQKEITVVETENVQISPNLSDKALHDYKLVRNAIDEGDQKAFAELMARYKDSIYFMLLKMVNNRDDAEDLTIEAFGKAFKNIRQYTPDYAFSTWLFKIATNNCIDFIRKKRKQAFSIDRGFENEEGQEMVLEVKSLHPDPEEHYMKKQKVEMMRDVVDKLKPRYKKLVELRYFQELAYEEIAAELSLPLGTVKAQLFRAREFLYQIMKNSAHQI